MIIRAGCEIRRLLLFWLPPSIKVDNSFLLWLTIALHLFVMDGNDLGAMWEEMLVVNTCKGEAVWEKWEVKLMCEIWECKVGALCEAELVWEFWEDKGDAA